MAESFDSLETLLVGTSIDSRGDCGGSDDGFGISFDAGFSGFFNGDLEDGFGDFDFGLLQSGSWRSFLMYSG